jgi:hypothetical protein
LGDRPGHVKATDWETSFGEYLEHLREAVGHSDRRSGLVGYCQRLILPICFDDQPHGFLPTLRYQSAYSTRNGCRGESIIGRLGEPPLLRIRVIEFRIGTPIGENATAIDSSGNYGNAALMTD